MEPSLLAVRVRVPYQTFLDLIKGKEQKQPHQTPKSIGLIRRIRPKKLDYGQYTPPGYSSLGCLAIDKKTTTTKLINQDLIPIYAARLLTQKVTPMLNEGPPPVPLSPDPLNVSSRWKTSYFSSMSILTRVWKTSRPAANIGPMGA